MLSLTNIHADWLGQPGASLGSEVVRGAILANPRIASRLMRRVLHDHNVPADDSESPGDDRGVLDQLFADPERFVVRTGLAVHGNYLSTAVDRVAAQWLAGQFELDDLRRAVRLRRSSPLGKAPNFDDSRLSEIVSSTGEQCVVAWAAGLSDGLRRRVMLLFPKKLMRDQPTIETRFPGAAKLVRALAADVLVPGDEREQ
jgi:hypothetical protein